MGLVGAPERELGVVRRHVSDSRQRGRAGPRWSVRAGRSRHYLSTNGGPSKRGVLTRPSAAPVIDQAVGPQANDPDTVDAQLEYFPAPDADYDWREELARALSQDDNDDLEQALLTAAATLVTVPSIEPGEDYEHYADRLRELDLQPVREDLTEIANEYGPDDVISTRPGAGARSAAGDEVVVVVRPRRQRCDLSDPTDRFQEDSSADQWTPFAGDSLRGLTPADPKFETPLHGSERSTDLLWGTTSPAPPPTLWDGYGYRHIAAKHGWSDADERATRDVLLSSTPTPVNGIDRWRYVGQPYPGADGRPCVRIVGIRSGDPAAEGIVTSYGGNPLAGSIP